MDNPAPTIFQFSPLHRFALARQTANGTPGDWLYFPKGPSGYVPTQSNESNVRIDGTEQISRYYTVELTFTMLTSKWKSQLSQLFDPKLQNIWLNYPVPTSLPENSQNYWVGKGMGWRYSRAKFAKPPRWSRAENINFYDCVVTFTFVEWYPVYF